MTPMLLPPLRVFSSGAPTNREIAITFDDGPHPTLTCEALDELRAHNIKAAFFVQGDRVKRHPEILQRVAAEGHEIGNHSYTHPHLPHLDSESVEREIIETQNAIKQAIGYEPVLFRPPHGELSCHAMLMLQERHMDVILWSVDSRDWQVLDAEKVYDRVTHDVRNGSIILFHDVHPTTIQALPRILDALGAEGYHFVTISRLCGLGFAKKEQ